MVRAPRLIEDTVLAIGTRWYRDKTRDFVREPARKQREHCHEEEKEDVAAELTTFERAATRATGSFPATKS